MDVQPGLCGTWSETPKTRFLTMRLISMVEPLSFRVFTVKLLGVQIDKYLKVFQNITRNVKIIGKLGVQNMS